MSEKYPIKNMPGLWRKLAPAVRIGFAVYLTVLVAESLVERYDSQADTDPDSEDNISFKPSKVEMDPSQHTATALGVCSIKNVSTDAELRIPDDPKIPAELTLKDPSRNKSDSR